MVLADRIEQQLVANAREFFASPRNFRYDARRRTMPPRRDLELDALVEILEGQRLVHSHSYRQDEILMLIRLAEDYGFTIGTFQHVLEGYKVAEAIGDDAGRGPVSRMPGEQDGR